MTDISDLLDRYWQLAYAEGRENRQHDTENGDAQECRSAIDAAFSELEQAVAYESGDPDAIKAHRALFKRLHDAEARLAEARADALEEAAKLLDAEDARLKKIWDDFIASGDKGPATSSHGIPAKYAAAIRALKGGDNG